MKHLDEHLAFVLRHYRPGMFDAQKAWKKVTGMSSHRPAWRIMLWTLPVAAALFLAFGVWALGSPTHKYWGRPWGFPNLEYDRIIGLDTEVERENWDKVMKRSEKDLYMTEASCCYNLAFAMDGRLGHSLFNYAQNYANSLLLWITTEISQFSSGIAGEAWYQLGNMTLAEQSAMIALQASPRHTGARYLVRLAKINLINGEDGAAEKYLGLLSKTLSYGKWARSMMPGHQDEATKTWIAEANARLPKSDFVYSTNEFRPRDKSGRRSFLWNNLP